MGDRLKAIWAKVKEQVAGIWDKDKGIFFLVALVALIVKFRDLIIDILVNSAKRVKENADKKDEKLAAEEIDLKKQADQAVQDAQNEPSKQQPVDDDWYKKNN